MASRVEERSGFYADGSMNGARFAEHIGVPHGTVKRWLYEGMPCKRSAHHTRVKVPEAKQWIADRYPKSIAFKRESVVYFVRSDADGSIKIGYSSDIERRLREIRKQAHASVTVLACIPGAKPDELALHARFAADLIGDEWFRPSDAVLGYIAALGRSAA